MNWNHILCKLVLVCFLTLPFVLSAEEGWTNRIISEESDFFAGFSGSLEDSRRLLRKDWKGRDYTIDDRGKYEIFLNGNYDYTLPGSDWIELHINEAEKLNQARGPHLALLTLSGIDVCLKELENETVAGGYLERIKKVFGVIYTHWTDKAENLNRFSDPFGCYVQGKKKSLVVSSNLYPFKLYLPEDFQMKMPDESDAGKNNNVEWKLRRFYQVIPGEKKDMAWEMKNQETGYLFYPSDKIILTLGMTLHFSDRIYDKNNYYIFWDLMRGLNKKRMSELKFLRSRAENGYESSYSFYDKLGKKHTVIMREMYYLRGQKGIFLMLSYPEYRQDYGTNLWKKITSEAKIR